MILNNKTFNIKYYAMLKKLITQSEQTETSITEARILAEVSGILATPFLICGKMNPINIVISPPHAVETSRQM